MSAVPIQNAPGPRLARPRRAVVASAGPQSAFRQAAGRFLRNRPATIGAVIAAVFIFTGLFAPIIAHTSYSFTNLADALVFPNGKYWLGTDADGRDFFSRLVYAARTSLTVGFAVPMIAIAIGIPLGSAAGWLGGKVDFVVLRIIEFMTAFPSILFAIFLSSIFGAGLGHVILYLGLTGWVETCRLSRAQFLTLREREFVTAARAVGTPERQIMLRHVLINAAGPLIIQFTLAIPGAIVGEAGLSFLGLGVSDPLPSWGKMLSDGGQYAATNWYLIVLPIVCIALTLLSFSFIGDGLRDALDPYERR